MTKASGLRTAEFARAPVDRLSELYQAAASLCTAETAPCTCLDACERDHTNE